MSSREVTQSWPLEKEQVQRDKYHAGMRNLPSNKSVINIDNYHKLDVRAKLRSCTLIIELSSDLSVKPSVISRQGHSGRHMEHDFGG